MGTRTGSHGGFHSAEPDPEAEKKLKKKSMVFIVVS
jgi:hypothetical protein